MLWIWVPRQFVPMSPSMMLGVLKRWRGAGKFEGGGLD